MKVLTKLHIYFLPTMAPGHMIPMIDIARHFAKLGMKSTIITTPLNAIKFSKTINQDRESGSDITISLINFPSKEVGLPQHCENLSSTTTAEMTTKFFKALDFFQEPVEKLLLEGDRPDCIVAGSFFWWATDTAKKFNIPRIIFHGSGFFPICAHESLVIHKTHANVGFETEEFVLPGLPDPIVMTRQQLGYQLKEENQHPLSDLDTKMSIADKTSYGIIINSFYELEPNYANHFRQVLGRKAWHIGPVSLFNKRAESSHHICMTWLDSKKPDSVLYVCFGSSAIFSTAQLLEIAKGLEASGQQFIWVVGQKENDEKFTKSLENFEHRVEGLGLIIKGWAPQVPILEHEATGGFLTHCGWNSLLEGVAAGLPMITWPLCADQFFNEKLITNVLRTGIEVGNKEWAQRTADREVIKGEKIEKAVVQLMGGEEAENMKSRAKKLGHMAKKAVEQDGSSYADLNTLLEDIRFFRLRNNE